MPALDDVRSATHDLLVDVVDADRQVIEAETPLALLGVDSLSVIEIVEILGARFDVEVSDDTIDSLGTVDDIVHAVVTAPDRAPAPEPDPTPLGPPTDRPRQNLDDEEIAARKRRALVLIAWFAVVGVCIGLLFGVGGSALFRASGLGDIEPLPMPTPTEEAPATNGPPATTDPDGDDDDDEDDDEDDEDDEDLEATLEASPASVSAGSRINLTGAVPGADAGATLQVQRQEANGQWQDFPVTVTLNPDNTFATWIQTSRQGAQEFRLQVIGTDINTPTVRVNVQ